MPNTLTRQLDWAQQRSQQCRDQMAQTVAACRQLTSKRLALDNQIQKLSQDWQATNTHTHDSVEPLQNIEDYRQFLMKQKNQVQLKQERLAEQLGQHRRDVLQCEQRLRILQRRRLQQQQRMHRQQQQAHSQLLDRYSRR